MVKQKIYLFGHWRFIVSNGLVCLAIFDDNPNYCTLISLKLYAYKNPPEYSASI